MDKYLDEAVKPDVQTLLRLKMETPELGEGKRMDRINDYLDQSIEEIERIIEQLPPDELRSWESLNRIFLHAVMR
jgi:predicted nucleotidyltransferase